MKFSAIWIDKNEPKNYLNGAPDGCGENPFENPPYLPSNLNCYAKNDLHSPRDQSSITNRIRNMILKKQHAWFDEYDIDDDDDLEEIDEGCHANEIQHETICMTAEMEVNSKKERHYNAHGLYGNAMTQAGFQSHSRSRF